MAENSTNVRVEKREGGASPVAVRRVLAAAQAVSPALAARLAERVFVRPPPRRRPTTDEARVLASADRYLVPHVDGYLMVWRWGAGQPVILLHGWGGNASQMAPFVAPLLARGYSPVAFDAPGHGESDGATSSLPQFASALTRVAAGLGPVRAIVTHSMGGAAASLAIAQGGLHLARAAFVGPPADARHWLAQFGQAMELDAATLGIVRARIEERLGVPFDRLHAGSLGPDVRVPLLVVHDRGDKEVPFAAGELVARTAVNAKLVATEGLGHRRILRDEKVIDAVADWVAGQAEGSAARAA
jgi:pimeloyl-ACP methyl ester carboxylesterase